MKNKPKIVVIGGGTGSFTLLGALKFRTPNITALVNMADDGGSTGLLRDELGVLPPGDIRQCLVALSHSSNDLRELFNYRFPEGARAGHSFGNLFLSAVEKMSDDFGEAVSLASKVLQITGRVVPITLTNTKLIMEVEKKRVKGEYKIANTAIASNSQPNFRLEPQAVINPVAREAIKQADLVVIAPGNLYGSLVPALIVKGVAEALQKTKAPVAFVCNLVNKPNQTTGFTVRDYIIELERFIGKGTVDAVLYNTARPSKSVLAMYEASGEELVVATAKAIAGCKMMGGAYLAKTIAERAANDHLIQRSLIRHDAEEVATTLMELIS